MAGYIPGFPGCGAGKGKYQLPRALASPRKHGAGQPGNIFQQHAMTHSLYDQITDWQNLLLAYRKAAKGKRGQPNVAEFEYHLEDNLFALQHQLQTQTYQPGAYHSFFVHEPKKRLISAAPFRDRVVHHALCNLIEPIFERSFIYHSYANRIGKGTHRALNYTQACCRRFGYVLQCDIAQFFPAIDHAILRAMLYRKLPDVRVRWLCDQILNSGAGVLSEMYQVVWFPGDDLLAPLRPRGLPIGNLTSQFWANIYLNGFDHFVTRHLRPGGYLRYVDDFLLFADDKVTLWHALTEITRQLNALRLTLHPGAHPVPVSEGIPFLGFRVYPQKRLLKARKGLYYRKRLHRLYARHAVGEIPLQRIHVCVSGWVNHVRYGNTVGLRKAILGALPVPPVKKDTNHAQDVLVF